MTFFTILVSKVKVNIACEWQRDAIDSIQLGLGQNFQGTVSHDAVADLPFNVISQTSPYLAMWDTVQTNSSDRIYRGCCVYVLPCV